MRLTRLVLPTRAGVLATLLAAGGVVRASPAEAQEPAPAAVTQQGKPAASDSAAARSVRPRLPLLRTRDLIVTAALATTSAALIPVDARIAREFQRPELQSSALLRHAADGIEQMGSAGAVAFGGSLYVVGLAARKRTVADLGWHTLEALLVSGQVTTTLKGLFGRTRPYAAAGDAQDFDLGAGFGVSERRSFPSGHTSTAFAFASVLSEETSHRWPRAHRVIAPLAYAAATGVGLARMYNDKHWASDVALGAAVGMLSGRIVVRYAHGRPRNLLDRIALWPVGGGGE